MAKVEPQGESKSKEPRIMAALFKTGLPVEDEDAQDDEEIPEDADQHLKEFMRGSKNRVLDKNAPAGHKTKDVTSWISKLSLSAAKKTKLKHATEKLTAYYFKLPKIQQNGLKRIAVDWGLGCNITSKMPDASLIKVLAAALTLSN